MFENILNFFRREKQPQNDQLRYPQPGSSNLPLYGTSQSPALVPQEDILKNYQTGGFTPDQKAEQIRSGGALNLPSGSVLGDTSGGGATIPAPSSFGFNDILNSQKGVVDDAYKESLRRAGAGFDRARGIFDEGIGLLGTRRKQFGEQFETGKSDILDRFEESRGQAQRASQGARTKSRNAFRALGLGGSAFIKQEGRQKQAESRASGEIRKSRESNEAKNLSIFDERNLFADTQENALMRALSDANEAKIGAEASAGLAQRGDTNQINSTINSFLDTILQNQLALNATNQATGDFVANPYAVNIADVTGGLQSSLPNLGGISNANENVSIDENRSKLSELLKKARLIA